MKDEEKANGLGNTPKSEWPEFKKSENDDSNAIDRLRPGSDQHNHVRDYLMDRVKFSEQEMNKLKPRWKVNEMKYQAYVKLEDWEQQLQEINDSGAAPKVVSIVVPYSYATISTIVTYLIHTFAGRRPIFQVGSNKSDTSKSARNMEIKLQYDADHTRLIKHLFQFLLDSQMYGLGIMRCQWQKETKLRTRWVDQPLIGTDQTEKVKRREEAVTFEGNDVMSIDPYNFLPDPRVPMTDVNKKGEFVFWKSYHGRHELKNLEKQGKIKYVNAIPEKTTDPYGIGNLESSRSQRAGGEELSSNSHHSRGNEINIKSYVELHQGTVEVIPAELGIGESEFPEKWIFTIANRSQIIQAQQVDNDHDMHPVAVTEPYTMGYSFGQLGIADYLNPLQDHMSWLVNSHMDNVRTALNNMFVFDPSRIELQDLTQPGAGKLIRAKKAAYGQDIRQAIHQFNVQDVTSSHMDDFQKLMRIGDTMSSVTDNLRGLQDSGGRKTATEVRTSGEAGASRLAAMTRLISAQAMVDLTQMMSLNNQQHLSDEFYVQVVGQDGLKDHIKISPEMLTGDFHYPIHDGTLPLDRVAMVDVWKEILMGVSQDEQLRGQFDVGEIFKYTAELGGAKNIERFELQTAPDEEIQEQVAAGKMVSTRGPEGGNTTPGVEGNPAGRLMM